MSTDRPVVQVDIAYMLRALRGLPKRAAEDPDLEVNSYFTALLGIPKRVFDEAITRILQGVCRHAFFPSPPEVRLICNAIIEERATEQARQKRREEMQAEAAAYRPRERSAEERARVAEIYSAYCADYEAQKKGGRKPVNELAAIRAKYDPAELAKLPDQPEGSEAKRRALGSIGEAARKVVRR